MAIYQLDQENADFDIQTVKTVLTHTPDANHPMPCMGMIKLGDGTKDLTSTGGEFTITVSVGGNTVQGTDTVTFGTEIRAVVYTEEFVVPPGDPVLLKVTSPNADSDVDITAYLFAVSRVSPYIWAHVISNQAGSSVAFDGGAAPYVNASLARSTFVVSKHSTMKGMARPIAWNTGTNVAPDPSFPSNFSTDDLFVMVSRK